MVGGAGRDTVCVRCVMTSLLVYSFVNVKKKSLIKGRNFYDFFHVNSQLTFVVCEQALFLPLVSFVSFTPSFSLAEPTILKSVVCRSHKCKFPIDLLRNKREICMTQLFLALLFTLIIQQGRLEVLQCMTFFVKCCTEYGIETTLFVLT